MIIRDKHIRHATKEHLFKKLKEEDAFWSYDNNSVSLETLDDNNLIALVMRYLDLADIKQLFSLYSASKIKNAWKHILVPEGKYLYTLNRFFAWYYFKAKNPDSYLKSIETRHLNSLC